MYKYDDILVGFRHAAPGSEYVPPKRKAVTEAFVKMFNPETGKYEVVSTGKAECSRKDQFRRKLGRVISLGRALNQTNFSEEVKQNLVKLVQ